MALALDDLFTASTAAEVEESILAAAVAVGLPATSWQPGGIARTIIKLLAVVVAVLTSTLAQVAKGGFLDEAEGGWLDLLAWNVYRVERQAATFAQGELTLTNTEATGSGPHAVGTMHFSNPATLATYSNAVEVTVPATGAVTFAIAADVAGSSSSSAPGLITGMVTPIVGVTASNVLAVLGGDGETDPQLRAKCREKLAALSPNGAKDAYVYFAKGGATGEYLNGVHTSAPITRARVRADRDTGIVTVTIANSNGPVTLLDVQVVDALLEARAVPWCVQKVTASAATSTVNIIGAAWVDASPMTPTQAQAAMATAIATYFATHPIGGLILPPSGVGRVYIEALEAAAKAAVPGAVQVKISTPANDVDLAANQVPILGTTSFVVTPVAA